MNTLEKHDFIKFIPLAINNVYIRAEKFNKSAIYQPFFLNWIHTSTWILKQL